MKALTLADWFFTSIVHGMVSLTLWLHIDGEMGAVEYEDGPDTTYCMGVD